MSQSNSLANIACEQLMNFISEGRTEAFDELYKRHAATLTRYFFRMLNNDKELALDAVQDLFLKIAESPGIFNRSKPFKTWMFSIASNYCKNFYRHKKVEQTYVEFYMHDKGSISTEIADVIQSIDRRYLLRMLDEVLLELPIEKREVIILKYQEERSIAEIAEIQKCSEGTVKSRLHHAVKILQEKLNKFKNENSNEKYKTIG
ncbi:MAG: sigma-70 family RNA polymerase sigma factor [Sphingobacteriaceae bacterium]|nr:sigma-70 family RNA polymerase sigma factor [Sphingobacteriaceae bacterium]